VTLGEETAVVHVFVPVMEAIGKASDSLGMGDQLARLRIDWSGFDLTGGAAAPDLSSLNAATAAAPAAQGAYTSASYESLAASVAAGEYLTANSAALTVTQEMVDARAAAIRAAKAALLTNAPEAPVSKEPAATETVAVTPEIKESESSADGKTKIVENIVTAESAQAIAKDTETKAAAAVSEAKAEAAKRIAAGTITADEVVVAEVRIEAKTTTPVSEIKETVTNIPAAAIVAVLAAASNAAADTGESEAKVELVLTVESDLAIVTFDGAELAALINDAAIDAIISVTVVADARNAETDLTAEQASFIPADKTPFAIEIAVNSVSVTGELASEIAVTIPYAKQGGTDKKVVLWYVPAAGSKAEVNGAVYENGKLTFTTKQI
jgi:hypothetical protein